MDVHGARIRRRNEDHSHGDVPFDVDPELRRRRIARRRRADDPDGAALPRSLMDAGEVDSLLAHLSYEEEALHDPLAIHGFG